ncbi:hypothetical protein H0Z09_14135 [Pseudomonas sp. SWRI18]|uniref:hypothetical protein n=1 Tax=Pseudomonas sp. SWRI18 TaxID=2753888 RepID=UPI0016484CF3|nr:hypothetical protein [Pseudomonas sp. SWRI18]MBC3302264.1 hypothetical protein [Pseudomonas sp. SWRI18]
MNYTELKREFESKNIPFDTPSFYDHENFMAEEQKDGNYLNNHALFVATRPYSREYLDEARSKIVKIVETLHSHLVENGKQGACIDISTILMRCLELEGIWCACLRGSVTVTFPEHLDEGDVHFYSFTKNPNCTPGHYWVYAPPFKIIDITIQEQPYGDSKKRLVPSFILAEETEEAAPKVEDIFSPEVSREMATKYGIAKKNQITHYCRSLEKFKNHFPPQKIQTKNGAAIKYIPLATHASEGKLEVFGNFDFNGLTPYEFYQKFIKA